MTHQLYLKCQNCNRYFEHNKGKRSAVCSNKCKVALWRKGNDMNLDDASKKFAHKAVELMDSTAYAYIKTQMDYITSIGEDPRDYEVVMLRDEVPKYDEDSSMRIDSRIRVQKIKQM